MVCHDPGIGRAGDRYDVIGHSYVVTRREDHRVAAEIHAALGPTGSVVNVGAGSGGDEPTDRTVIAVEPSVRMIEQRSRAAPAVRGVAEGLPFADGAFDVAKAVLRPRIRGVAWDRRHGHLRHQREHDGGYRIAVAF